MKLLRITGLKLLAATLLLVDIVPALTPRGRDWGISLARRAIPNDLAPSGNIDKLGLVLPKDKIKRSYQFRYRTAKTEPFFVDGKGIPDVDWDAGESYAGLLPISKKKGEDKKLFFWFFPKAQDVSSKDGGDNDLTIWLNGGPGCSSFEGLFQENGPFLWQTGTYKPARNRYSWTNLTSMLWVEQPVGTGFTEGKPSIHSSAEAAEQFIGFYENFIDTFELYDKKIYIAGESYAGMYIPYLADAFFKRKEASRRRSSKSGTTSGEKYFDLQGTMLYDPYIADESLVIEAPAFPFVQYWQHLFAFDSKTMTNLSEVHKTCGYESMFEKYFTFPPQPGGIPPPKNITDACDIWGMIFNETVKLNPCFNIYHITDACPLQYDVLGFPGSFEYLPPGAPLYFNRADVKKAIHAPLEVNWTLCTNTPVFVDNIDNSPVPIYEVLPRVIEKSKRSIISHGLLDFVLLGNGTLMAIQNMTWNGQMGFQKEPKEEFVLHEPYSTQIGVVGKVHTERGLTWTEVANSGHMGPGYQPVVAFKMMEYLLGRIPKL